MRRDRLVVARLRAALRAWRRAIWPWLDARLGGYRLWQMVIRRRRLRTVRRCAEQQHPLHGTLLPNGQPGRMCPLCGYVQQVTPREFKALFGCNVATAVARARAGGARVHNAARWRQSHPYPGRVERDGRGGKGGR